MDLWPTVLGVLSHFALRAVLDDWLNASSDAGSWVRQQSFSHPWCLQATHWFGPSAHPASDSLRF